MLVVDSRIKFVLHLFIYVAVGVSGHVLQLPWLALINKCSQ